jgi:threonine dehydrogenase-like Zn-dependent dehydrogenase
MYTSCLNYGRNYGDFNKGHRANGFTTDGGFAQYAVNHINTLVRVPDHVSDEVATLIVTAGTAMYGLDVLGGLVAGESLVVTGAGPIGLSAVAVGKALGAFPVILTDLVDSRLETGKKVGADHVINVSKEPALDAVRRIAGERGVNLVFECSGAPNAVNDAIHMLKRGGRLCLGAFSQKPALVDVGHIVTNNIYVFGIRGEGQGAVKRAASLIAQRKLDPSPLHTHTFAFDELPAIRQFREKIDGAIKVVIKPQAFRD